MQTSITTRLTWLGLGTFFAGLTGRVLLWDVGSVRGITPEHLLTVGAIIGAIASGVYFWHALRAWKIGTATGLGIAFLAATTYCLIGSAGRGDEQAALKNEAVQAAQDAHDRVKRTRDEAQARYDRALEEELFECRTGKGARCKSMRELTPQRRDDLELAEIALKSLKPAGQVNGKLKRAAELVAFFVTGNQQKAEQGLALLWPFLSPMICELLSITFMHLAFGAATVAETVPQFPNRPRLPAETRKPSPRGCRMTKGECERFLVTELALGRPLPSQNSLAARAGVGKGTVSKWLREWEDKGLVSRQARGRVKVIAAV